MSFRIGNGCGFWGDNLDAPILLARDGRLDVLTLEYLAELTMSILALQKERDPEAGFAGDFLDVLARLAPIWRQQTQLKIVTNAGGMNPSACARRAHDVLKKHGLTKRIAVVSGDDLMPNLDRLLQKGHPFANLDSGEPLATVRSRVVSANAYLGARPIADALSLGADLVITGRVADASLTVGPLMHHFGWAWDDWRLLGAATVAGHLIECGAQATGGLWCNYQEAPDLANVGYPIVDVEADGAFVLAKPPNTGGAVNIETVAEQLLYEVGDPAAYLTPDVVADFASVSLTQTGPDAVRVVTTRGKPATDSYKVSIAFRHGYAASGTLVVFGPEAAAKARVCGDMIAKRLERAGALPRRFLVEALGTGSCVPGVLANLAPHPQPNCPGARGNDPPEIVLRVTAQDERKEIIERFSKEFAPLVTSGPPGVTGYTSGRPSVREVLAYWPALVDMKVVTPQVQLFDN
ncbi:MAG: DUF1446 domain-containing protein [Gemmataceae bacterium]|nr:DUF1446 domain-containing protein [Gemmataceae bacterium]MCI0738020.1 DUF1446 domain-containing protein [Gemmataceae bacterium]